MYQRRTRINSFKNFKIRLENVIIPLITLPVLQADFEVASQVRQNLISYRQRDYQFT